MSCEPVRKIYRTWIMDSGRWSSLQPRAGDIVIATYPKCGTTWMQQIVGLLIFQTPEPRPVGELSPWIDRRLEPLQPLLDRLDAQQHRRFLKCHAPFDGMPIHDQVRYIHVARDGRDACLSYHNQATRFRPEALRALDAIGLQDELLRQPYPRSSKDARTFFNRWMTEGVAGAGDGIPYLSYFDFAATYWNARHRRNVLMVHYRDLKADLDGEMRRIAEFLGLTVPESVWPDLVAAATFQEMRRHGERLHPRLFKMFEGDANDFFQKGENDRWRGILTEEDLELYDRTTAARLPDACARWLQLGRLGYREPAKVE